MIPKFPKSTIETQNHILYIVGQKSTPRYLNLIPKGTKCNPKNPNLVPEEKNQPAEAKKD